MEIRVIWNVALCRLGIRKILPKEFIRTREERENGDPLINLSGCSKLFFKDDLPVPVWIRREVYQMLLTAADEIPEGLYFKIYDAYRPIQRQKERWEMRLKETQREHPDLCSGELVRLTRLKVAQPQNGYGGHQTGGAVDITICDQNGCELDMGGKVSVFDGRTETISRKVTKEQQENRLLLKHVLEKVGFKNYPREWWHFSYGDKMWAAYSFRKEAFYGYVEPNVHIEPDTGKSL